MACRNLVDYDFSYAYDWYEFPEITIPADVEYVSGFSYSYNLEKATILGGEIAYDAIYNCDALTTVIIGDDVTSIGGDAFRSCDNLSSVVIGSGVESIGSYAFSGCYDLSSVEFKDPVGWTYYGGYYTGTVHISSSESMNKWDAAYNLRNKYSSYSLVNN
jgi:hypothetical protein